MLQDKISISYKQCDDSGTYVYNGLVVKLHLTRIARLLCDDQQLTVAIHGWHTALDVMSTGL